MDAGKLDQRIQILEAITAKDALGAETQPQWVQFADAWARVMQTAGREFLKADALQGECKAAFMVRWLPGLSTAMRVLWADETYEIEAITGTNREGFAYLHGRTISESNA